MHHQTMTVLLDLTGVRLNMRGNLGHPRAISSNSDPPDELPSLEPAPSWTTLSMSVPS